MNIMKIFQASSLLMAFAALTASAQQGREAVITPSRTSTSIPEDDDEVRPHVTCSLPDMPEAPRVQWPDGIVYYEFDPGFGPAERVKMWAAMDEWISGPADLTYLPRTPGANAEIDYLYIQNSTSVNSSSYIGWTPGETIINILNWDNHGILLHELGHSLGFPHEQSRPDRDSYVTINYGFIQPAQWTQFDVKEWFPSWSQTPYDYGSVMHYSQCAFSSCPSCVTTPACRTITSPFPIGQRAGASALDQLEMSLAYGGSTPAPYYVALRGPASGPWGTISRPLPDFNLLGDPGTTGRMVYVESGTYTGVTGVEAKAKTIRAVGGPVRLEG